MTRNRLKIAAATAAFVGSSLVVIPALATPGSGFTPTSLSLGVFDPMDVKADKTGKWDLFLKTKAPTTVGVDRLTVIPGGQSGWHTHAGATLVTVTGGSVIWYDGANPLCTPTTYGVGDTFVEPANHVHLVRNNTSNNAEFIAVQIRPEGSAGRIDAPKPTNCPTI